MARWARIVDNYIIAEERASLTGQENGPASPAGGRADTATAGAIVEGERRESTDPRR